MSGVSRHKSSHFDYGLLLMYLKEILSIVVGLARGVELTLITKKKEKKSRTYTVSMNTVICLFFFFPYTLLVFNMAGVPS